MRIHCGPIAALWLLACSPGPPSFTPYGVPVDTADGPVLVEVDTGESETLTASVDTLSPFTIVDRSELTQPPLDVARLLVTMSMLAPGPDQQMVTRARFSNVEALELHPCQEDATTPISDYCRIGLGSQQPPRTIRAMVGADLLARNAVRFDFASSHMTFFPDIAGSAAERGALCDAVALNPFQGGGTVVIGGAELTVTGRRITLDTCFFHDPCDGTLGGPGCDEVCGVPEPVSSAQGVDGTFVLSTGLGTTMVNQTTYERYVNMHRINETTPRPLDYDELPEDTLHLPSGPVEVRLATMNNLAIVAESSDKRGPCGERYTNDYLTRRGQCDSPGVDGCPCPDNDFCRAAAVAELTVPSTGPDHEGFSVAVVPDSEPTLQALRNELRPELPEISGILGVDAIRALIVDVDYPNGRVMMRCSDDDTCVIRPQILSKDSLQNTLVCVPDELQGCAGS